MKAVANSGQWMRPQVGLILVSIALGTGGCSTLWPPIVRTSPQDRLFHASWVAGGSSTEGALCSLATIGAEATRLVNPPEPTSGAIPLELACKLEDPALGAQHGRIGQLVSVTTEAGPQYGYLFITPFASGLVVAFSGMGMPAAGWINARFAELGAQKGLITFAPVRDEAARPIYFDPLREAKRAIEAAKQIAQACHIAAPADISFVGISLGGLEALLANREALQQGMATRAAVLDPVLDVEKVTDNLDSYWHSFAVDTMQAFFRRILSGRYGEWPTPSFRDVMNRIRSQSDAITNLDRDAPSAWLCGAKRDAYSIFLSDKDPVLGEAQREFALSCAFPIRPARVPGHTPFACRLELFQEMIDALHPERAASGQAITFRQSRIDFETLGF